MVSDILEQIIDDYLMHRGYFTRHNIKFKPATDYPSYDSRKDSVHSDIDVLGFNPIETDPYKRVIAVSCKSWQHGFSAEQWVKNIEENRVVSNRESWKRFRELANPKWADAFKEKLVELTGQKEFTHVTAVTRLTGGKTVWEECTLFSKCLGENPVKIWTLTDLLDELYDSLDKTPTFSDVGRMLQIVKAAQWDVPGVS